MKQCKVMKHDCIGDSDDCGGLADFLRPECNRLATVPTRPVAVWEDECKQCQSCDKKEMVE